MVNEINVSLAQHSNIGNNDFFSTYLTQKAPTKTAADDQFCDIFVNYEKIRFECHAYLLLLKRLQYLKLSSAANYRWRFMG